MIPGDVWIKVGNLITIDQLAGYVSNYDDPVERRRKRPTYRGQIIDGKWDAPALALDRPAAGQSFLVGSLARLGALAFFFRLISLRFRLDSPPAIDKIIIGSEWHPPHLMLAIPTGKWNLADLVDQFA